MIREKITVNDFFKIAKQNEYYVWHFVQKDQHKNGLELSSIIDEKKDKNPLDVIFDGLDIPYYESYTEDSIEFLMGLGLRYENLYNNKQIDGVPPPKSFRFSPILILFKKFTKIITTQDTCYCLNGVIKVLNELGPKYLEQILDNIEKNPE